MAGIWNLVGEQDLGIPHPGVAAILPVVQNNLLDGNRCLLSIVNGQPWGALRIRVAEAVDVDSEPPWLTETSSVGSSGNLLAFLGQLAPPQIHLHPLLCYLCQCVSDFPWITLA